MNNNKKIQQKPFLMSAVAAVCILALSGSGNAATNGDSEQRDKHTDLTRIQHEASTFSTAKENSRYSHSKLTWHGATYEEWTQRWWQWLYSIPLGVSPWKDTTGVQCEINQSGPVWFIGGALGSTFSVSCTIPKGKAILTPIIDVNNDYPCPIPPDPKPKDYVPFEPAPNQSLEDFLTSGAMSYIDGAAVPVHTAELDGKPLHELRITSSLFSFTGAANLATPATDPCVTGSPQVGVSDGYFLFIEPLSIGHHTLHIHSESSAFGVSDGTYDLNIAQ